MPEQNDTLSISNHLILVAVWFKRLPGSNHKGCVQLFKRGKLPNLINFKAGGINFAYIFQSSRNSMINPLSLTFFIDLILLQGARPVEHQLQLFTKNTPPKSLDCDSAQCPVGY